MGITNIKLTIKNPADESKEFTGKFIVDSGASHSVVPEYILRGLNIKPTGNKEFDLVDGTTVKRKVGNAIYEFNGIKSAAPVIFGEKGDARLMGVITLEAMGLVLDPFQRKLFKAKLRM